MQGLIVFRGPPAVGKTYYSNRLKELLYKKSLRAVSLHWDDVLNSIWSYDTLNKDIIIKATKLFFSIAKLYSENTDIDWLILDAVFAFEEEIEMLNYFTSKYQVKYIYKLEADINILLNRNRERPQEDVLSESRIQCVVNDLNDTKNMIIAGEVVIKTDNYDFNLINYVISRMLIEHKDKDSSIFISDNWLYGSLLRSPPYQYRKISEIYFRQLPKNIYRCDSSFDLNFNNCLIEQISKIILDENAIFEFRHINKNCIYALLEKSDNNIHIDIIDEWDAPKLSLPRLIDFSDFNKNLSGRIRRSVKLNLEVECKFKIKSLEESNNPFLLWLAIREIESNSWKSEVKSDLFNLDREDLQYLFYIINGGKSCSLFVLYLEDKPISYSLMIRSENLHKWYAAKWGCSLEGREINAGIRVLYKHVEFLHSEYKKTNPSTSFTIDFWGRKQSVYNQLSTESETRVNFNIRKNLL